MQSEAQGLVDKLLASGMTHGQIGSHIGVSRNVIRGIARRQSTGGKYTVELRRLVSVLGVAAPVVSSAAESGGPSGGPSNNPAADELEPTGITIDAPEAPAAPGIVASLKQSIKDAMLGRVDTPTSPSSGKSKGGDTRQADFVDQATPLLALAVVVALNASIPNPYKPCAPQHGEAADMVRPLARIMSRQLEITGRLSDTAIDLLATAFAAGIYGQRAWETAQYITAERAAFHGQFDPAGTTGDTGTGNATGDSGANGYRGGGAATPPPGYGDTGSGPAHGQGANIRRLSPRTWVRAQDGRGQAPSDAGERIDPIARLYAADADGRRRLGI